MNPLRIFKRLRDLELRLTLAEAIQDKHRAVINGTDRTGEPKSLSDRMLALECKTTVACARCSAVMDITADRANGPSLIESGDHRAVVCAWCAAALKPRGWKPVKPTLPVPVEPEPAKEQEAPA